ncbi:MAG: tetratricopeptide repeat protein [Nitrospirae bacterium]|nr:tetratricopeptide repeat protein [Candidatus Manganitrophaceae bacterium]
MNRKTTWDFIALLLALVGGLYGTLRLFSGAVQTETFVLLALAWTFLASIYFRETAPQKNPTRKIVFLSLLLLPILIVSGFVRSGRPSIDRRPVGTPISSLEGEVDDFREALKREPLSAITWYSLGDAYRKRQEDEAAIASYGNAIALKEDFAEAYNRRGMIYVEKKGEVRKGIDDFDRAIQHNTNYAEAYYNRGNAFVLIDDPDRAILDYSRALDLKPNYAEAYASRSLAYMGKGDKEAALSDYQKALKLATDPSLRKEIMKGLHDAMTM